MRRFAYLTLAAALAAPPALAQDSGQEGSQASTSASEAVAHLGASGVKTAVGVSAVPLGAAAVGASVVGAGAASAGAASITAGTGLMGAAIEASETGLKVDDDVVVSPDPAPKVPYKPAAKK